MNRIDYMPANDDLRKPWRDAARDALKSGTCASLLSTAALAVASRAETGSTFAGTNAISHWIHGDSAARRDRPTLRHTLVGYAIHHGAALFWATFYERWFGRAKDRGDVPRAVAGGLAVSAVACFVDYRMTPHRLQPGYEMRLSKPALAGVYACFGLGLALGVFVNAHGDGRRANARTRTSRFERTRFRDGSRAST